MHALIRYAVYVLVPRQLCCLTMSVFIGLGNEQLQFILEQLHPTDR